MKQAKSKGEPWLFGIGTCTAEGNSTELETLLVDHGFTLKHARTAEEAEQAYFMRDGSAALRIPRRLAQEAVAVVT